MTATRRQQVTPVSFVQFSALMRSTPVLPTPHQLLDFQVETLVAKKLAKYGNADRFRKNLPAGSFIFVPAQPKFTNDTLKHLMSLVVLNSKSGVNHLDADVLKDEVKVPSGAHLMVGVEDGDARCNILPSENRKAILAEGRQPYNIWRGIVHAILFPETLAHHYMDLVASRYESERWPALYLYDGQPKLHAYWGDVSYTEWGAPSCGRVIGG